jgi:hypothetical protein
VVVIKLALKEPDEQWVDAGEVTDLWLDIEGCLFWVELFSSA